MEILVGYTGFVGSNLSKQKEFDLLVNRSNIGRAYDTNPDVLIYSGVPSEMFIANSNPQGDYNNILAAIDNIKRINPKEIVLISTTSVYDLTQGINEDHTINEAALLPYGKNRLILEQWVSKNIKKFHILRLPSLFGEKLRKNFIFDYITRVPSYLSVNSYREQSRKNDLIEKSYHKINDLFYRISEGCDYLALRNFFQEINCNTLLFTDSRSMYQYYPLKRLYSDIQVCLDNNIDLINLVTPPILTSELYQYLSGYDFYNRKDKYFNNNIETKWFEDKYIMTKNEELHEIYNFIKSVKL